MAQQEPSSFYPPSPIAHNEGSAFIGWTGRSVDAAGDENTLIKESSSLDEKGEDSGPFLDMQGFKLNKSEPWERSLLRLLQDAQTLSNTFLPVPATFSTIMQAANNGPVPELVLLGRSESRDYALEIERPYDDGKASLVSSRNTSPARKQLRSICRVTAAAAAETRSLIDDCSSYDEETSKSDSGKIVRTPSNNINNKRQWYTGCDHDQIEDRGEQDASDRESHIITPRSNYMTADGKHSFRIRKARAVREDDDQHVEWLLDVNDMDLPRLPMPDLRLPLL